MKRSGNFKMLIRNLRKYQERKTGKGSMDCPHCLGSSGIVADGKGSTCGICGGSGKVSKKKWNEHKELYG